MFHCGTPWRSFHWVPGRMASNGEGSIGDCFVRNNLKKGRIKKCRVHVK